MLRTSRPARGKSAKGFVSAIALSLALAGGAMVSNAAYAPAIAAQEYTEAFVESYQAIEAITQAEGATDFSAAVPMIPGMVATITNDDERFAAGNLILTVGQNQRDAGLQRQAIELMLESGQTPPEFVGQYRYYAGNFALQADEFAAGRAHLQAAVDAGFMPAEAAEDPAVDPRTQILQSYFFADDVDGGIAYADGLVSEAEAAGQPVPQQWISFPLQGAYDTGRFEDALTFATALVSNYPSDTNWRNSLLIVAELGDYEAPVAVDLYRLMDHVGAMSERRDYYEYIEALDPRLMSNEVAPALEQARADGIYPASDEYYVAVKQIVDERTASDREEASTLAADAQAGGALEAHEAAELFYSIGDYAQAEQFYAMALERGSTDPARDRIRQAIAQIQQGKMAEASATLEQVSGPRAPIAAMWQAYIDSQA